MKKLITITFICILLSACKKHTFDETLPKVTTETPTPYGNDSLIITGNVSLAGVGSVEYIGFCWDTVTTNPDIITNQILGNGATGNFSATIPYHKGQTYYIRAFAANNFGYTAGKVIQYPIDTTTAASPPTVPCSLNSNTFNENGTNYGALGSKSAAPSYGNYAVVVNLSNGDFLEFDFAGTPHNGTYTTTTAASNIGNNQVYASIITNVSIGANNQADINSGQSVYITMSGSNGTLAACSLSYSYYSASSGSFVSGTVYGKVSY